MTNPTDKELQEFWEWCGFKYERRKRRNSYSHFWIYPDGNEQMTYPPIDLNNLFKYAVPKVWELDYSIYMHIGKTLTTCLIEPYHYEVSKCGQAQDNDPALALYQAIQKARRKDEKTANQ